MSLPKPRRMLRHDLEGVPLVSMHFATIGYQEFVLGAESDTREFRAALAKLRDRTSLMLRFRPDRVYTAHRSVIVEVKSEGGSHSNFAIEADSSRAAQEWNAEYDHVMYCFVDLATKSVQCCWAREIPTPRVIHVPMRRGFEETIDRMRAEWPGVMLRTVEYRGGSGTPFFLVSKTAPFLKLFADFAVSWLIG